MPTSIRRRFDVDSVIHFSLGPCALRAPGPARLERIGRPNGREGTVWKGKGKVGDVGAELFSFRGILWLLDQTIKPQTISSSAVTRLAVLESQYLAQYLRPSVDDKSQT